jgi:hypothetical protein
MSHQPEEPPAIAFAEGEDGKPTGIRLAYLLWVEGVPWAYARLDEVHLPPESANAFRLDPSRIAKGSGSATGADYFLYRGGP